MSQNITDIADNLRQANSDLRTVVRNLTNTAIAIRSEAGFEDDMSVANISALAELLFQQVSLEAFRWNTIDDNRN